MPKVKICGIRTIEAAETAVLYGADAIGFVFYDKSVRNIQPADAGRISQSLPPFLSRFGVFADKKPVEIADIAHQAGLTAIQLHGTDRFYGMEEIKTLKKICPLPVVLGVRLSKLNNEAVQKLKTSPSEISVFLIDYFDPEEMGGTGKTVPLDLDLTESSKEFISQKVIIAGGLNPGNVKTVIETLNPYGIDVSSGVEKEKGIKDPSLIQSFLENAGKFTRKIG